MQIYLCFFNLFQLFYQVFGIQGKLLEDFLLANRIFSADTYRDISKRTSGNILICPLSAELILGLMRFGAKGNTAKALTLYLHNSEEEAKEIFDYINKRISSSDKYMLSLVNKVFLNDKYEIDSMFEGIAYGDFKTGIQNLDFSKPQDAVQYINMWAEKTTRHKIKNMVKIKQVKNNTSAILISTIYFRGNWANEFDRRNTRTTKFFVNDSLTLNVEMISMDSFFNFYDSKELDAQFLEMAFEGDDVALTIILPKQKFGLDKLESSISDVLVVNNYKSIQLQVSIPKFIMESRINYKTILKNMGVKEPFSAKADFSGISSSSPPLIISQVIQKTFFEINEKGATSAISTAVVCSPLTLPQGAFKADHPFVFYLKHKLGGFIFIGKYVIPPPDTTKD